MKEQERATLIARVAEDLAHHQYTQLVNENGVEVWRCKQPGTRNYHFDICVTAYGISMFGDIDGLIWNVGTDYGINFLRHQSDGYLHGKLESDCKREVIDFDSIRETVCSCIVARIEEELDSDEIPGWMTSITDDTTEAQAEELAEWMRERVRADDDRLPFDELIDVIEDVERFADGRDSEIVLAYDFLQQHEELIGGSDLWETRISKPCPNLMARLFYVRHAANAIMAIKEQAAAA
ncbi:hypothetical protein J3P77_09430 [Pseudomonas sp. R1-18]|uniref:hypothetical protein n=1 Tax=Pseudomonas sp. R1-18 TaxID=1632772 RepID=UPI003DA896E5